MRGSLLLIGSAVLAISTTAEPVWKRPGLLPQTTQDETLEITADGPATLLFRVEKEWPR